MTTTDEDTPGSNNIAAAQNSESQLRLLAARKILYGRVGKVQFLQAAIPIINALVWPLIMWLNPTLAVWSALCGFAIPLINEISFEPLQTGWKLTAAKIQELFDCEVLSLTWNTPISGRRPNEETITCYANKYDIKDVSGLIGWYPSGLEGIPVEYARLICQRTNCWWDSNLRKDYISILTNAMLIISLVAIIISLAIDLKMEMFVASVLAPFAPAFLWGLRERSRQLKSNKDGERLLEYSEEIWDKGISGELPRESLTGNSRILQDGIYARRCTSPVNPSWLYILCRDDYQKRMENGARKMIARYKERQSGL
ncbi:MAG: S-4TM family putative pore-forming effector [Elusimicrobiota bacterium]|nr:S-4TM family putative pore-forming effector [Elusimicrobiota bacterium]